MMYLRNDDDDNVICVFARRGGTPRNPDWYFNLTASGEGSVERGTESYQVTVRELPGAERDRVYAEQARRYPGFADYERHTRWHPDHPRPRAHTRVAVARRRTA